MATMAVVERCGIAIVNRDADRKMVFGEVMLPCKRYQPGDKVPIEELRGRVHYDGGAMTAEEIQRLSERFAVKRPRIDVEHDGVPRAAEAIETFIAQRGWEPWTEDAWVVGTQFYDDPLWQRTEEELRAYSIQFVVRIEQVPIVVVEEDGSERSLTLSYFEDTHPQFLSLVRNPATGATWKIKSRGATLPAVAPIVDREWNADEAYKRIQEWAGDDLERMSQARLYTGDTPDGLIADIDGGGRLVVVRSAVQEAVRGLGDAGLSEEDERRAEFFAERYGVKREAVEDKRSVVPFQDLPLADAERAWDAQKAQDSVVAWAGGADEWEPDKLRTAFLWYDADAPDKLGSYKLGIAEVIDDTLTAVPRGIAAAAGRLDQTDVPSGDVDKLKAHLARYYKKMDRPAPWEEGARQEPPDEGGGDDGSENDNGDSYDDFLSADATSVFDGADALASALSSLSDDDKTTAKSMVDAFAAWAHGRIDEMGVAGFGENQGSEGGSDGGEEGRSGFAEMMTLDDFHTELWRATDALHSVMYQILNDDEVMDKTGEMRRAIAEFAAWATAMVGQLDAEGLTSMLSARPEGEPPEDVERKGAKMAKKRLEKLTAFLEQLAGLTDQMSSLVADLQPFEAEEDRTAGDDPPPAETEPPAEDPPAADVARSQPDDQLAELREQIAELQRQNGEMLEKLSEVENARPAPSIDQGTPLQRGKRDPYEILGPVLGLRHTTPKGE